MIAGEHSKEEQALLAKTAQAARAAGCTEVQNTDDYQGGEGLPFDKPSSTA